MTILKSGGVHYSVLHHQEMLLIVFLPCYFSKDEILE